MDFATWKRELVARTEEVECFVPTVEGWSALVELCAQGVEATEKRHRLIFLTGVPGHDCAKNAGYPDCDFLQAAKDFQEKYG